MPLLTRLRNEGYRVVAAGEADSSTPTLTNAHIEFVNIRFDRKNFLSHRDVNSLLQISCLYARFRPTLAHLFQAKPVILGNLAARLRPTMKVVNTITGLGHSFIKGGSAKQLACVAYKASLRRADRTIFQNPDDMQLFLSKGLLDASRASLVVSSGVDTSRFRYTDRTRSGPTKFVMLSRILWEKGVGEFVEAARICKRENPTARFLIGGEFDENHASSVPKAIFRKWVSEGVVEYLGHVSNVEKLLHEADVAVLPSYREGVPRVLLEAAATGLPVVTCDTPGCREAVEHGTTGILVPPRDARNLAIALAELAANPDLRKRMGIAGRRRIEGRFDLSTITKKYLAIYRGLGLPCTRNEKEWRPHGTAA